MSEPTFQEAWDRFDARDTRRVRDSGDVLHSWDSKTDVWFVRASVPPYRVIVKVTVGPRGGVKEALWLEKPDELEAYRVRFAGVSTDELAFQVIIRQLRGDRFRDKLSREEVVQRADQRVHDWAKRARRPPHGILYELQQLDTSAMNSLRAVRGGLPELGTRHN